MSTVTPEAASAAAPSPSPRSRPLTRTTMHWIRRLHLYLGLFLFPWAVLYGFTGFLFNHPRIMNEQQRSLKPFGPEVWAGTPMAQSPDVRQSARDVIAQLEQRDKTAADLRLVETEPVRYSNDFAFARFDATDGETSLLLDVHGHGGTTRQVPPKPASTHPDTAPWSVAPGTASTSPPVNPLFVPNSIAERLQQSIPQLSTSLRLPEGKLTVTSVPDLLFVVESDGKRWRVTFNSLKGTLTTKAYEATSLPLRNFLLRLHTTHVYPFSRTSAKWLWVLGADVMGIILMYWGISGLLMWWQIKSTRRLGAVILAISACVATFLAISMHAVIPAG